MDDTYRETIERGGPDATPKDGDSHSERPAVSGQPGSSDGDNRHSGAGV